jgi:hypothetical protein
MKRVQPRVNVPVKATFGWILIVLGGFLAIGAVGNAERRGWESSDVPLWWLGVFLPVAGGALLVASRLLTSLGHRQKAIEDQILRAAAANGGTLTAAELAQMSPLTLDDAEATLRLLSRRAYFTPDLSDDGVMVYRLGTSRALSESEAKRPSSAKEKRDDSPQTIGLGLDQLSRLRTAVSAVAWTVVILLLAVSVIVTVAGPRLWPSVQ